MEEFNKLRILPRDNLSKHDYVKRYFYQNKLTKELYDSEEFSDDQLLYIFNNNTLKRLGFPVKRCGKKRRMQRKERIIRNPVFFDIVYKTTENVWEQYTLAGLIDPFKDFVDCKDLHFGDKNMFTGEING
jgi:hypothetical protein|nr:MAG TPA: hypothetical protein [Caudoviricetes sp.]